jgi:hypothetical protein
MSIGMAVCVHEVMLAASSLLTISIQDEIIMIISIPALPTHPCKLELVFLISQVLVNVTKSSRLRTVSGPKFDVGDRREGG